MKTYYNLLSIFLISLVVSSTLLGQTFNNPLPIPYLIETDDIRLVIEETEHNFNPNGDTLNEPIRTFAFNAENANAPMTILGPTIKWRYGHNVKTKVRNRLDVPTTCHWHGAHVPQYADGGPHQAIGSLQDWSIDFDILDKSATMWYHPHLMGTTYEHVQMGLSGMVYVEDPDDAVNDPILTELHDKLPHHYGQNDFPIIVQTKKFVPDPCDSSKMMIFSRLGFKTDFEYLVNGVMNPYLEVPADFVRLRLLNGDGKFAFMFGLGNIDDSQREGFTMIATDAGYMDHKYEMENLVLAPGERAEIVLDLRNRDGDVIYLQNRAADLNPGIIGLTDPGSGGNTVPDLKTLLEIRITGNSIQPLSEIPYELYPLEVPTDIDTTRIKNFYRFNSLSITDTTYLEKLDSTGNCVPDTIIKTHKNLYNIDSTLMDMRVINDVVKLGDTEKWTLVNNSVVAHPWHIHDIHFWVTEILDANNNNEPIDPESLPHIFKGPKDNVLVEPGWTLSYVTTFNDYGTPIKPNNSYMYHCHILPHEDRGMMGQFVVWDGVSSIEEPLPVSNLQFYPNPAFDEVHIKGSYDQNSRVRILNLRGQVMLTKHLVAFDGQTSVNIDQLNQGFYIIEWSKDKELSVGKLMISR